jgi:hypothetical protein
MKILLMLLVSCSLFACAIQEPKVNVKGPANLIIEDVSGRSGGDPLIELNDVYYNYTKKDGDGFYDVYIYSDLVDGYFTKKEKYPRGGLRGVWGGLQIDGELIYEFAEATRESDGNGGFHVYGPGVNSKGQFGFGTGIGGFNF